MPATTSTLAHAAAPTSTANAADGSARSAAGVTACQCSDVLCTTSPPTTNSAHAHSTSRTPPRTRSPADPAPPSPAAAARSRAAARTTSARVRHGTRPPPLASTISA